MALERQFCPPAGMSIASEPGQIAPGPRKAASRGRLPWIKQKFIRKKPHEPTSHSDLERSRGLSVFAQPERARLLLAGQARGVGRIRWSHGKLSLAGKHARCARGSGPASRARLCSLSIAAELSSRSG